VTKECSQYNGQAGSFCTITSSNVEAIAVGSRVVYLQPGGPASLDSDIVVVVGPGNYALAHVTLDFATATGEVRIWGGTGQFTSFHAKVAVSALGGPNWAWDGKYHFGPDEDWGAVPTSCSAGVHPNARDDGPCSARGVRDASDPLLRRSRGRTWAAEQTRTEQRLGVSTLRRLGDGATLELCDERRRSVWP
jgi:hypothetical protein